MSIIHDALKKTEKSIDSPENTDGSAPSPEVLAEYKKRQKAHRITLILLYIVAIGGGLIIAHFVFGSLNTSKFFSKTLAPALPVAKKPAGGPIKRVSEVKILKNMSLKDPKKLELNGVFFSEEESYALVNNRVVKVGDKIGGATVRKIDYDGVELVEEGSAYKLSTK